ncbi:unnamed protein product [Adineta ricciae]|uniref:VWFA domain-containing protein n=1 Tax=Adineta ricciae TaxID=249248 RepID=A0A813S2F1_ADIRI|nr:unnamed protein product [Adineta ricciae]CAF0861614.1 unnamed protein product [Adineta ricciae]
MHVHQSPSMTSLRIILIILVINIKYERRIQASNLHDIPNVSFSDTLPTVPLLSAATNQYLRDQLVYLTEQFSALTLPSTDRMMREVYMQSSNTFIIEKRNLSELVIEMANYTNRAIMKKLEAIRNLVTISEQSYRRFAETDEATRNETVKFMETHGYLSTKHVENNISNTTNENASLTSSPSTTTTTSSAITITDNSSFRLEDSATKVPLSSTTTDSNTTGSIDENPLGSDVDPQYRVLVKNLYMQQKKHFGGAFVNITHSTVHVPTIIYYLNKEILLTANWSYNLNQAFIDNYNHDPELTWQYFCSQTGLYRVWPGHKWEYPEGDTEKLDLFDCRVQNWYIRATSSPRDVIILIDASGSMTGLKKSIAVQTVETILDTLSDDDFVQIIKFQEEPEFVDECFQDGLVQATFENRHRFRQTVNEPFKTKDIANFSKALNMAFNILDDARTNISLTENVRLLCQCHYLTTDNQTDAQREAFCPTDFNVTHYDDEDEPFLDSTGCNKMIMIVTDGATETALSVFQSRNWTPNNVSTCHPIETRVFTYMIGRELGDPKHIRWMSCANKGYFAHVSTLEDIQENVEDYIPVTARPIAMYNDHVTVWSSVFLDVERTLPIKTYKWFPFKFPDLSISMDEFRNKSKPVHLMISIAQPILNPPKDKKDETILLGAVGVDIPVKLIQEFSPKYRLGVHAYSFMINHNGYLMFHPDLRPVLGPYRKQNYHSIDLDMVEIPDNLIRFVHPLPASSIQAIRKDMILSKENQRSARVKKHLDDMRRIEVVEQKYYYATLGDKESNPFSLGIAVRFPYGEYHVRTTEPDTGKAQIALRFILQRNVRIADWIYCNSTAEDDIGDTEESFRDYLKEKIETMNIRSCPYKASKQLIYMMIEELFIMSKFENWTKNGAIDRSHQKPIERSAYLDFKSYEHESHIHWIFLATRSGITAYWRLSNQAIEDHIRQFGDANPNSIESNYYERTINATHYYGADHIHGKHYVYSLFYGISSIPGPNSQNSYDNNTNTTEGQSVSFTASHMYLVITTGIWMNKSMDRPNNTQNVPFGVFGVMLPYKTVRSTHFSDLCSKLDSGVCYIIDENGFIMFISQQQGDDRTADIGKFLGEFEGLVMQDLVAKKIFAEEKMVDFQGVCLHKQIVQEKSSGHMFRSILYTISSMIWSVINHIAMFLVHDILVFPRWTYASRKSHNNQNLTLEPEKPPTHTRESLSNVLLTHIDFRRPILDHREINGTKEDESVGRIPLSCIEEFNLYVSTWKGWEGPLPSKDNRLTWEEIERANTVHGAVDCAVYLRETVVSVNENGTNSSTVESRLNFYESFGYSISKIPRSNLMLLYVNHSKEASVTCPKLVIKRRPVEFTKEEWCTRLKTTPYRERPHKCFFVHEGENQTSFSKCSYATRLADRYSLVVSILLLSHMFFLQAKF